MVCVDSPINSTRYDKCNKGASTINNECTMITMSALHTFTASNDITDHAPLSSCINRPPTPPIIPSVTKLHAGLKDKFRRLCGDVESFRTRSSVKEISKILTYYHQSTILLDLGIDK